MTGLESYASKPSTKHELLGNQNRDLPVEEEKEQRAQGSISFRKVEQVVESTPVEESENKNEQLFDNLFARS